ncbi:PKD domain-containing protein [Candidatus Bipolaricaulota bacterium]
MARRSVFGILLVCTLSLLVVAQQAPTIVQPREAGHSAAQLSVLEDAITRLQNLLNSTNLGSKKQLSSGGWTLEKFAAYTAGTLERLGYLVAIVSRQAAEGGTEAWVVVQVDLGGATAWIPVEPLPNVEIYQMDLGEVPLVASLVYDSDYLSYDTVIELPANLPPTARIRSTNSDVVETKQSPWFGNTSSDPDGEIVLFQWTFGDDTQRETHTISTWFTFDVGGMEYPVSLTVTDNRGAQASTSTSVYVLTLEEEEAKSCGCGG